MDGEGTSFVVSEERNRGCDSICALALACPHTLHRRRTAGDRQQRGRKSPACRGSWTKELLIRRLRLRWRTCRRQVQPDRSGETGRARSGTLSPHRPGPERGPSHQTHRGTAALESRPVLTHAILPGRLERVTKPPKPNPHRRSSVIRYGRCAASRSVVGSCRTVLASSTPSAKRRTAARLRSRVSHRHSLCPSQRHFLADAPAGTRVWIGNDVLAARARLATDGRVGSDPLCAPGLARSNQIDWSRAVVDSCSIRAVYGGDQTGPNPTDRAKRGSKRHLI